MTPAPQLQEEKYNCYAAISNEWKTLEEIIGTHTGSGLPKNSDIVRYRNALNGYVDARLVEKEKEICGRGHNQRYRIRSRPAPSPEITVSTLIGYEQGLQDGATQARKDIITELYSWNPFKQTYGDFVESLRGDP